MNNFKKGFAIPLFFVTIVAIFVIAGVSIYKTEQVELPKVAEKQEPKRFELPEGWHYTNGGGDNFVILKSSVTNDSIEIKYFYNLNVFETDNGKFGNLTLTYSEAQKCWLLGQYNAKSGFVESCQKPTGKTSEGNEYFRIHNGYSYIVIKDTDSFVLFNVIGDDREALALIVQNLQVGNKNDSRPISVGTLLSEGRPVIESISPTSGPIGTVVTITGRNMNGFEGDMDAWIQTGPGEVGLVGFLQGTGSNYNNSNQMQTIKVKIEKQLCNNAGFVYSGIPCTNFTEIKSGVHYIYVSPWGNQSNSLKFTVTD